MRLQPVNYYHMHVGHGHVPSRWEIPAEEHFAALVLAGFTGTVRVGLIGDESNRHKVRKWLDSRWPKWQPAMIADDGYEQWTINAMHCWAKAADPDTPVLYNHTKGAFQDTPHNHNWRRAMETALIGGKDDRAWLRCIDELQDYDLVGCHWLTPQEFPVTVSEGKPFWGGNFWWAKAGYLAKLAPVEGGNPDLGYNRYKAEEWVGQGNPRVLDLIPGWPQYEETGGYNSVLGGRLHG